MTTPAPSPLTIVPRLADALHEGNEPAVMVANLLRTSVDHADVERAAVALSDDAGRLDLVDATDPVARELLRIQSAHDCGPSVEAHASGRRVTCDGALEMLRRWPRWTSAAVAATVTGVVCLPLRCGDEVLGTLDVYTAGDATVASASLTALETYAAVTAVGLLTRRRLDEQGLLAEQLRRALDSRVVVEQAKGVLCASTGMPLSRAFGVLRAQARHERRPIGDVAAEVVATLTGPLRGHGAAAATAPC
ncbi:ANTAR domain-containing protein [Mobilicoccus massiliensis]|uniref:ANTAR domain-containing protein n=1 Tax=Mobilicoccus massiliensis TaxID=1522310 RepID=UPI00058AF6FD|nr:GAF and ANTAR domain-containing protein [Mobilicoccus massiliensis]